MAYNNNNNRPNNNYNRNRDNNNSQPQQPKTAKPLPKNYVDCAEKVIIELEKPHITTSKIRNLLSLISDIYNVENIRTGNNITKESEAGLTRLRIRMVYEAGRDKAVKAFLEKSNLIEYLKDIGTDREKLINYAHYMEALVAYHRFLIGGREG